MLFDDAKMCVILERLDLFSREKEVLQNYRKYINTLERNGISVREIIMKKMNGHRIAWMKNEFPYDIKNSEHYLIWSTEPLTDEKIREIATKHARGRDFFHFVNPENLQSVKDMWHAHIIFQKFC